MADAERLINRMVEQNESSSAPTPGALLQCPGFELVVAPTANFGAGMFSQAGRTFFVTGFTLYELNSDNTTTMRGIVARDTHPVTFMSNGDGGHQLGLTSGNQFYVLDLTTNVLTNPTTIGATMCGFLDGFGVILDANSSTLQVTAFEDFTSINPGNIAQRTAGSDPWVAMYVVNRLIYLLGERTSEVWWDAGTSPFPFAPIQEAFMQQGTAAAFSGARLGTSLIWLSHNDQGRGQIVSATGYTPGRISTHAVEASIATYGDLSDAVAFSYQENGHTFHVLTFPSAERTWVFDQSTGLFHERLYWNTTTAEWLAYRPLFFCSDATRNLVQDRLTGAIYRMSTELFTDIDGAAIRRVRQPPRLSFDQKRFVTHAIQLVMDVGQGLQATAGSATAQDAFSGGASTSLSSNWTVTTGQFGRDGFGHAYPITAGVSLAFWNATTFSADQSAQVTIVHYGDDVPAVVVRLSPSGDASYAMVGGFLAGAITLYHTVGGVGTAIQIVSGLTLADGDVYQLNVVGSVLQMFLNGTQIGTNQADAFVATGQPGLFINHTGPSVTLFGAFLASTINISSQAGVDPQIMRQTSQDGGQTWGNEQWASAGAIGAYDTRVRWTQCGQARNRVDRFIDTDPVPSRWVDALIDISIGTS